MATLYVSLGSNIEPTRNLPAAVALLRETVHLTGLSPVYRTPPWGVTEQADFLNAVASAESSLEPLNLLKALQGIEAALDRKRDLRWGPRTIDLDLLCWGDLVLNHEWLQIPHPRLHERAFALKPLCDLEPGWVHPLLGRSAAALLAETDQSGMERVDLNLKTGGRAEATTTGTAGEE